MNKDKALSQLFGRVSVQRQPVYFGHSEVQEWQEGVLDSLLGCHLVVKSTQADSVICEGCEEQCPMPVILSESGDRAFVVCDHPEHQNHMGRINIPLIRLQQWQSSADLVAKAVMALLKLTGKPEFQTQTGMYKLGFVKSDKGRRVACLQPQPLALVINQQSMPIDELVYFNESTLEIDQNHINALLSCFHSVQSKGYIPNSDKRALRKLQTQAQYTDWQDEYLRLSKKYSNKSDTWIAHKIAKLPMGQGKSPETIRKNMKN